jgi:hypothetical protein
LGFAETSLIYHQGATITGQQFGVATSSTELPNGLMGVGPGVELTGYPTIIDTLVTEGFTQSRAFSLDLRGVDTPTGNVSGPGIRSTLTEFHQVQSYLVVSTRRSTLELSRNFPSFPKPSHLTIMIGLSIFPTNVS